MEIFDSDGAVIGFFVYFVASFITFTACSGTSFTDMTLHNSNAVRLIALQ
jgi:hypothetical protein